MVVHGPVTEGDDCSMNVPAQLRLKLVRLIMLAVKLGLTKPMLG